MIICRIIYYQLTTMEGKTIFDLPTTIEELPGINDPMSRMQYEQHAPTRDMTGASFPNGQIHTRFEISGTKRWVPAKSYLRLRCRIAKALEANGDVKTPAEPLAQVNDVSPNMGLCANLFQSGEFRIADKTVSRCSDYMAQVDALSTRMDKSKAWLDSVGKTSNMWEASHEERKHKVSIDGETLSVDDTQTGRLALGFAAATTVAFTDASSTFTFATGTIPDVRLLFPVGSRITFPAQLGAEPVGSTFLVIAAPTALTLVVAANTIGGNVGAAVVDFSRIDASKASRRVNEFELVWQPPMSIFKVQNALPAGKYELVLNPQTAAAYKLRAVESLTDLSAGGLYDFSVLDMYLYVATVESTRIDDLSYYINLDEVRCQVDTAGGNGSLNQKNFDVSPSTYALTAAYQDQAAGSDVRYSASKFKTQNDEEKSLTRLFISYGGQSKPSPDSDASYVAGIDRTTQRYVDSLLQSGQYFREGGSESIEEWGERGQYYHFAWPRDGRDRSTRVQVNQQLTTATNTRVLLFDHYKSVAHISIKDGRVVDVNLMEA